MKTNAKENYDATMKDNNNLLKMIAEKLEKDAIKDRQEGISWGHLGSLNHTKELLKEIMFFLGNCESEKEADKAIEAELVKARKK